MTAAADLGNSTLTIPILAIAAGLLLLVAVGLRATRPRYHKAYWPPPRRPMQDEIDALFTGDLDLPIAVTEPRQEEREAWRARGPREQRLKESGWVE